VWWTQFPDERPVLTGWFGGPKSEAMTGLGEGQLIEASIGSLAGIFRLAPKQIEGALMAARSINWKDDPLARGAYSYATPCTQRAQAGLASLNDGRILISGEALYRGKDIGTVEAALAHGLDTVRRLLAGAR
jgi:monoamine oxidase